MKFERKTASLLRLHLEESPVTWIRGARQVGKSTLAKGVGGVGRTYQTLDDATTLAAARRDPDGFILTLRGDVTLDEVQRVPDLFRAIKLSVDRDRRPGRFLLTGSANVFARPTASESLAGRMQILSLEPLAQAEIEGGPGEFIAAVYAQELPAFGNPSEQRELLAAGSLWRRIVVGGYPDAVTNPADGPRSRLLDGYVHTLLDRDIRDIADISRIDRVPELLEILASRTSNLMNRVDIGRALAIPKTSLDRYLSILEALFIHQPLGAYHADAATSLAKAAKVQLLDTGLATHTLGLELADVASDKFGRLLESFVCNEIRRLLTWHPRRVRVSHFRTKHGAKVDLVLEDKRKGVIGIEVKGRRTLGTRDFNGLAKLREVTGERFFRGIVLYTGDDVVRFGDYYAVPLDALWRW